MATASSECLEVLNCDWEERITSGDRAVFINLVYGLVLNDDDITFYLIT